MESIVYAGCAVSFDCAACVIEHCDYGHPRARCSSFLFFGVIKGTLDTYVRWT